MSAPPPPAPAPKVSKPKQSERLKKKLKDTGPKCAKLKLDNPTLKKTDGPEDRSEQFKKEALAVRPKDEEVDAFLEQFLGVNSRATILQHEETLESLRPWLEERLGRLEKNECLIVALDFDYTLKVRQEGKLCIRGGEASSDFLSTAKACGCELVVITAQEPNKTVVRNLQEEIRDMGAGNLYDCARWDRQGLLDMFRRWGPNENLSDDVLQKKLAVQLTVFTDRLPADLSRVMFGPNGFAPTFTMPPQAFTEKLNSVLYRLWVEREEGTAVGEEDMSALLRYEDQDKDERSSMLHCWLEYDRRHGPRHWSSQTPDRLFLRQKPVGRDVVERPHPSGAWWEGSWSGKWWDQHRWQPGGVQRRRHAIRQPEYFEHDCHTEEVDVFEPVPTEELEAMVLDALIESGAPSRFIADTMSDTILEHDVITQREGQVDKTKVCQKGRLMASRYNKPEAIELFIHELEKQSGKIVREILFVDDSAANAFNVFLHFGYKEVLAAKSESEDRTIPVYSVWWPPPPTVNSDLALALHTMCLERLQARAEEELKERLQLAAGNKG